MKENYDTMADFLLFTKQRGIWLNRHWMWEDSILWPDKYLIRHLAIASQLS